MERAVGKNEKLESFKLESLKLERAKRSWKEPSEIGKNRLKLERFAAVGKFLLKLKSFKLESLKLERARRNWKESIEVGKNRAKLERIERNWKASFESFAAFGKFWLRLASLNELGKL